MYSRQLIVSASRCYPPPVDSTSSYYRLTLTLAVTLTLTLALTLTLSLTRSTRVAGAMVSSTA